LAGKPLLGHILERLSPLPIEEVIFITGYLGEQIEEYVTSTWDFPARFVVQQEQLGQAHAIQLARDQLHGPTFVVFADTIFETDITRITQVKSDGLLYVREVEDPRSYGVAVMDGEYIARLVEKSSEPESNLAVVGLYYFSEGERLAEAVDELLASGRQTGGEYYLADAIQIMIDRGAKIEVEGIDVWLDCGRPSTLLDTNRHLLGRIQGNDAKHTRINTTIVPPVYIGKGAQLTNSVVGPNVSVGAGVEVSGSLISESILGESCRIVNSALVGSIIGHGATVYSSLNRLNVGDTSSVNLGAPEK